MISEAKKLKALRAPEANRFVSQEKVETKIVSVKSELATEKRLRELGEKIQVAEREFLESVAKDHPNDLIAFFNDPRISPSAKTNLDLGSYMQKDTLRFTVSTLAPKAGNPNKTDQVLPDLGEVALLTHFEELALIAERRYNKNVEFTILTEGKYVQLLDLYDPKVVQAFDSRIKYLSREIVGNKKVKLRDWYEAVSTPFPLEYKQAYDSALTTVTRQYNEEPLQIEREFLQIFPTIYMTNHAAHMNTYEIYSLRRGEARQAQMQAATDATLRLMAFNRAKAEIHDRERIFPGYIYGTLTPGTGKFAFYAIGPWNERYPNHGIGVMDMQTDRVSVRQRRNVIEDPASTSVRLVS